MAASAILFDLDGTIWDSIPWYAAVLSNDESVHAADLEKELRDGGSIITIAGRLIFPKAALVRACRRRINELELFPGVRNTLDALDMRSVPMGIVTSLAGDLAAAMMEGTSLDHRFQTVVHPGICRSRKPSGMPLKCALNHMGIVASKKVFYVGDRADDAQCAKACGVSFAWASYGYGERPGGDSTILRNFEEVLEL